MNVIFTITADTRFDVRPSGTGVAVDIRVHRGVLTLLLPDVAACDELATFAATCAHLLNLDPGQDALPIGVV